LSLQKNHQFVMLQKSMCQEHRINCFQLVVSHFRIEKLELLPVVVDVQVLYHVLGCVPQYQARVVPLLNELCKGLEAGDLAEVCTFEFLVVFYSFFSLLQSKYFSCVS
jgi:hypothetical protein